MESAAPTADVAQRTTRIRRTAANRLTFQFPQWSDQPSTIRRLDLLEEDCAAENKTSRSVHPLAARGNRTPDVPAPARNRNHRLHDLAGDKSLRNATTFRNRDLRSTESYGTFRLQKFDSRGVT